MGGAQILTINEAGQRCRAYYGGNCCVPKDLWLLVFGSMASTTFYANSFSCKQGSTTPPLPPPPPVPPPVVGPTGDLGFTSSNYGSSLPIVFGSDKFTGNVFWTSPYEAKNYTSNTGEVYTYYTVSFALGLCEGELQAISRLWVGTKLVYNTRAVVDGDNVVQPGPDGTINGGYLDMTSNDSPLRGLASSDRQTKLSLFTGSETQVPSGVMVDEDGYPNTPAYRGLAYVLFENFITTEQTVPAIVAEVNSNSADASARLYFDFPTPQEYFNRFGSRMILPDHSYGRLHVFGVDTLGAGTVPLGEGLATFNMNDLSLIAESEIETTEGFAGFNNAGIYPLSSGLVLLANVSDNLMTYQPYASVPAGILPATETDETDFTGFRLLREQAGCTFQASTPAYPTADVFFGVGSYTVVPDPNASQAAFVQIDRDGRMEVVSIIPDFITDDNTQSISIPLVLPQSFRDTTTAFVDNTATISHSVWTFYTTAANDTTQIDIKRTSISGETTIAAPITYDMPSLNMDGVAVAGQTFTFKHWLLDTSDFTFIIIGSTGGQDRLFKYNPFNGSVIWKSTAPHNAGFGMVNGQANYITGQEYAWVTSNSHILVLDVKTGVIHDRGTLTAQALPTISGTAHCYDGRENTLYYVSNTNGQRLVKVLLGRVTADAVPVSTIVTNLLARVGVQPSEIDIEDLSALTVLGYTIANPTQLRVVFDDLRKLFKFDLIESNGSIVYRTRGAASSITIPHTKLADIDEDGWIDELQDNQGARSRKINLTYRDFDREYEQNVQTFSFPHFGTSRIDDEYAIDVSVPVVIEADTAKSLAEVLLYSKYTAATNYRIMLGPEYLYADPGDVITVTNASEPDMVMRIRDMTIGDDRSIEISAAKEDPDIYNDQATLFGNVGLFTPSALATIDPRIDIEPLPITYRSDDEAQGIGGDFLFFYTVLNVAGDVLSDDPISVQIGSNPLITQQPLSQYPTWGYVMTPPVDTTSQYSTDDVSTLRVRMVSTTGATIGNAASKLDLVNTPQINLALVGGELIQFQNVSVSGNVYTFTGLHRGKFNTEAKINGHAGGEKFILLGDNVGTLDITNIRVIALPRESTRYSAGVMSVNSNNPFQPRAEFTFEARNQKPWKVAALKASYDGSGHLNVSWEKQARYDAAQWPDDGDFEAVNDTEPDLKYAVFYFNGDLPLDLVNFTNNLNGDSVTTNAATYADATQVADGFDRATDSLWVVVYVSLDDGGHGVSDPTIIRVERQTA